MTKILIKDYPSQVESKLHGDYIPTFDSADSDVIVNPEYGDYIGKEIIINLPVNSDLGKLAESNHIISRFPISPSIEVQKFEKPLNREKLTVEDYSCLILNADMLEDIDLRAKIARKKFLVGLGTVIDDAATLVGLELCRTKLECIIRDDEPF